MTNNEAKSIYKNTLDNLVKIRRDYFIVEDYVLAILLNDKHHWEVEYGSKKMNVCISQLKRYAGQYTHTLEKSDPKRTQICPLLQNVLNHCEFVMGVDKNTSLTSELILDVTIALFQTKAAVILNELGYSTRLSESELEKIRTKFFELQALGVKSSFERSLSGVLKGVMPKKQ